MELAGTTAIVTGAASGLGAATAAALAQQGAHVVGLDLPDAITDAPDAEGVEYLATDVTDAEQVNAAVHHAAESAGPLRTVVNCAGIGPSMRILGRNGIHDIGLFAKVLQVNLLGTFTVMVTAAEAIAATRQMSVASAESWSTLRLSRPMTDRSARRRTRPPRVASWG
jgi:NAD(P)-dependent dehydrogenase (short-subunit alcohol dehydrogenase family)